MSWAPGYDTRLTQAMERVADTLEELVRWQKQKNADDFYPENPHELSELIKSIEQRLTELCDRERFNALLTTDYKDNFKLALAVDETHDEVTQAGAEIVILNSGHYTGMGQDYLTTARGTMERIKHTLRGILLKLKTAGLDDTSKLVSVLSQILSDTKTVIHWIDPKGVMVPDPAPEPTETKTLSGLDLEAKLWEIYGGISAAANGCNFTWMLSDAQKQNKEENTRLINEAYKSLCCAREFTYSRVDVLVDLIHGGKKDIIQVVAALHAMQAFLANAKDKLNKIYPGDYTDNVSHEVLRLDRTEKLIGELITYLNDKVFPLRSEGPMSKEKIPALTIKTVVDSMCGVCSLLYSASVLLASMGEDYREPSKMLSRGLSGIFQASYWSAFLAVESTTAGVVKLQSDIELALENLKVLRLKVSTIVQEHPEINENVTRYTLHALAMEILDQTTDFLIGIVEVPKEGPDGMTITQKLNSEED